MMMRKGALVVSLSLVIAGCQGSNGPSTGAAGGDLTGTFPNPTIGQGVVDLGKLDPLLVDGASDAPSLRTLGTGGTQAAAGDDPRLFDARVPTGAAAGDLTGSYPFPSIADGAITGAKIATSLHDAAAATPSLRSLGTGAAQAAAGTDPRLSDSRPPNGNAGGSLSGSYPSPSIAAGAVGPLELAGLGFQHENVMAIPVLLRVQVSTGPIVGVTSVDQTLITAPRGFVLADAWIVLKNVEDHLTWQLLASGDPLTPERTLTLAPDVTIDRITSFEGTPDVAQGASLVLRVRRSFGDGVWTASFDLYVLMIPS